MTLLLAIVALGVGFMVLLAKALAVDEAKGRIQRYLAARLNATIDSLPEDLQDEWADEWRAELAAVMSMPWTAYRFVSGVRAVAGELIGEPELVPVTPLGAPVPRIARVSGAAASARKWARRNERVFLMAVGVSNLVVGLLALALSILLDELSAEAFEVSALCLVPGLALVLLARTGRQ